MPDTVSKDESKKRLIAISYSMKFVYEMNENDDSPSNVSIDPCSYLLIFSNHSNEQARDRENEELPSVYHIPIIDITIKNIKKDLFDMNNVFIFSNEWIRKHYQNYLIKRDSNLQNIVCSAGLDSNATPPGHIFFSNDAKSIEEHSFFIIPSNLILFDQIDFKMLVSNQNKLGHEILRFDDENGTCLLLLCGKKFLRFAFDFNNNVKTLCFDQICNILQNKAESIQRLVLKKSFLLKSRKNEEQIERIKELFLEEISSKLIHLPKFVEEFC